MMRNIRDTLIEVAGRLRKAGISNSSSEARAIVAKVINREINRVHPAMNIDISDDEIDKIYELVSRRINREPLQLIIGFVGFYDCVLKCEEGVFIPRVETELIVDIALKYLFDFPVDLPAQILDLACGCGAISIALALTEPRHRYHAVDISPRAVNLAKYNALMNNVADKINFMCGDYFDAVRGWENFKFDIITANPPYIKTEDIKRLPKDVRDWDPREALDGGKDGLSHYAKIASELDKFLDYDGIAIFEIDPPYVEPLKEIFHSFDFEILNVYQDYNGHDRAIDVRRRKE